MCKGAFPYDGIIRIRFMGMFSATPKKASTPLAFSLKAVAKVIISC